ncbi:MAG: putative 4-mercaptohistidine N1-methyltransferase, partial [Planctomycetota bacterium]
EAEPLPEPDINVYETDQMVARYIEFHYGNPALDTKNFPLECVKAIRPYFETIGNERALDIGCAAGRTAFELANHFKHVDAVDFSVRLIEAPSNLQKTGKQRYVLADEGELQCYREIRLDDFPEYVAVKDRISFMQGDACNLVEKYSDYDLVFAGNLIDRLYDPGKFLSIIKERIRPGGMLVLSSPYTWLEEYTPRDRWLGGFKANTGENFTTLEGVEAIVGDEFTMLNQPTDISFAIRETRRKFHYGVSQLTIWRKNA